MKFRKNTMNVDPKALKTENGKTMLLSKCVVCGSKKSRLIKKNEASGLLSSLGIKAPLSKIQILDKILLWWFDSRYDSYPLRQFKAV